MRTWISTVCILFAAVVCRGEEDAIGPVDFAVNKTEKSAVEQYYDVSGDSGGHSILKIYENGTWKDARVSKDSTGKSVLEIRDGNGGWNAKTDVSLDNDDTYVISHGLNSTYDSDWIRKSAKAIKAKNPNAVIISVNWDHYSGTKFDLKDLKDSDPNFGASSWINLVTPVLADNLKEFKNIKSFVGHSYGAHLLAATAVTMKNDLGNNKISFVALDPAEETLTYTGDKDGKPTWMWSKDKKSKNWDLPSNVESEVYKSSGFLGSEERLGKYNYFLAAEASITPRGLLGDLDPSNKKMDYSDLSAEEEKNGLSNHSLAPAWFAEFITKQKMGDYEDGNLIGGWFKSDADKYREERSSGYWDGIVNANTSPTDPRLEYAARGEKESFTEWQDLCDAEAQYLLHQDKYGNQKDDKSNWNETVLKPSKYDGYYRVHGNRKDDTTTSNAQTTSNNGNSSGSNGSANTTRSTTQSSSTSQNRTNTQTGSTSTSTTSGTKNGNGQNTRNPTTGKTPQTRTTTTSSTTTTPGTTTTSGNNTSTGPSGIAEWRKIAYRILTGQDMPDNTDTQTTNGQNQGNNSSGDKDSGSNSNGNNGTATGNNDKQNGQDRQNGQIGNGQVNGTSGDNGQSSTGSDGKTPSSNNQGNSTGGDNGVPANVTQTQSGTQKENTSGQNGSATLDATGTERPDTTGKVPSKNNAPKNPVVSTTQDDFVNMDANSSGGGDADMSALAQQMLKEYLTGESQVLSPDFIQGAYGSLSSDPQKAETIAREAFGKAVDSLLPDSAVSQAIKDFVAQGGGDMGELSSLLGSNVTEEQKSQIQSLYEGLNNVAQDGGKSLVSALGEKGADLANSLAVNEVKGQLLSSLPKDQAEMLNSLIGTLDTNGLSAETKQSIVNAIKGLVDGALPEYSAESVNNLLQSIADGKSIDVMDTAKDLGKSITADTLKSVLNKNLDPQLAEKMNALIDAYMENGAQGLSDAALKELNALIDKYAPGANTAKLLKDTVNGIVSGTANPKDWKDIATSVVADTANKLIDSSNLPDDVKAAAKTAIDGLAENGLTGLTTNVRDFISDFVSDKLGDEAGEAVGKIFDAVVTPGADPWQEIVAQAPVIGVAVAEKCLSEAKELAAQQIDKLIAKYPNVKKVLDKLGINGDGVIQGFVNVLGVLLSAPSLSDAITQLSKMAVDFLKGIAAKLIDWALEWAVSWINNTLMPKVLTWASDTLGKWADSVDNKLIKQGLEWLQKQCERCKKQGGIKIKTAGTGEKVINYVEDLIKKRKQKQSGTTVLQRK